MKKEISLYIASPLGFSEPGRIFLYDYLTPLLKKNKYIIIDPWKLTPSSVLNVAKKTPPGEERCKSWQRINKIIGENNVKGIDRADGVVAILDGVDVDSGTASEIGYAFARGIPIFGYRSDFRQAGDNEGSIVNLQVEYFIKESGGFIIHELKDLPDIIKNVYSLL